MTATNHELRLPAIEITQGASRKFYSFAIDGKLLPQFATISRIRRDRSNELIGYQRPEVLSHIAEIRRYIESENPLIPNAIVIAFNPSVRFEPGEASECSYSRWGTLVVPLAADETEDKPGLIVDGQQRSAAIRDAQINHFPICATAFIAESEIEQREQFILVNSTKPLPKGLIYELLPDIEAQLPTLLQRRKFPARLLATLNSDTDSPLKGKIRTPTTPDGVIQDNSILKMLENSLSDGVLYRFRDLNRTTYETAPMLQVVKNFWSAASHVFPDAWELPPARSRLTHGAGVVSMGFVMDAIADRQRQPTIPTEDQFRSDLQPLKEVCRWTDGYWDFGPGLQRKWNEVQNTPKDIQLLTNYLLLQYKRLVWNHAYA